MKKKVILLVAAILVVGFVVMGYIGTRMAKKTIEEQRHNILGLALDIKGYDLSIIGGSLKLKGIKIYPSGNETDGALLAATDELFVKISPLDLLRGTLHAKKITFEKPQINYFIEKGGANWNALKLEQKEDAPKDPAAKSSSFNIIIDKVKIEDGTVAYKNNVNGQHLSLKDVDIEVDNIAKATKDDPLPTEIELDANIDDTNGEIKLEGKADPLGEKISFDIKGGLTATPITAFSSFYAGSVPFGIVSGAIAVKSEAKATDNILKSTHHATISGLKADSSAKGTLVNKLALKDNAPINVTASVNGDLTEGKFSVATNISKEIADQILKRAGELVPNMATEEIKKAVPKDLGTKLKGIFKR